MGDIDAMYCSGLDAFPALVDSHMHVIDWGIDRNTVDLSSARSAKEILDIMGLAMQGDISSPFFKTSGILIGSGYDDSSFSERFEPRIDLLDGCFGEIPVLIKRVCGHKAFANSAFMDDIAGLDRETTGGRLDDSFGLSAIHDIDIDGASTVTILTDACYALYGMGVIGGVEITSSRRYPMLAEAFEATGKSLKLSVSIVPDKDYWEVQADGRDHGKATKPDLIDVPKIPRSQEQCPISFLKGFADGSIGSGTAAVSGGCPEYPDMDTLLSSEDISVFIGVSLELGLVPMVHAIGDRAVGSVIKGSEGFHQRIRMEHGELIRDDQMQGLVRAGIDLCMQPNFVVNWGQTGGLYERRLGDRYMMMNKFRTLMGKGVPICFGTDMMPPGPLFALGGCSSHPNVDERIPFDVGIRCFSESAGPSMVPGYSGSIVKGRNADIMLMGNKRSAPSLVIMDGRIVHLGPGFKDKEKH